MGATTRVAWPASRSGRAHARRSRANRAHRRPRVQDSAAGKPSARGRASSTPDANSPVSLPHGAQGFVQLLRGFQIHLSELLLQAARLRRVPGPWGPSIRALRRCEGNDRFGRGPVSPPPPHLGTQTLATATAIGREEVAQNPFPASLTLILPPSAETSQPSNCYSTCPDTDGPAPAGSRTTNVRILRVGATERTSRPLFPFLPRSIAPDSAVSAGLTA